MKTVSLFSSLLITATLSPVALAQSPAGPPKASTMPSASAVAAVPGRSKELRPLREVLPRVSDAHKQLEILAGDWVLTGRTLKGSPWGEGKFTGREHNEFMKGGMFLVTKTQYSEQFNNSSQIGFYGVDPKTGEYTFSLFNSLGVTLKVTGRLRDATNAKLAGNAIIWGLRPGDMVASGGDKELNVDFGGDVMQYTTEIISRNEYRFSFSRGGVVTYEGTAKRVNAVNR